MRSPKARRISGPLQSAARSYVYSTTILRQYEGKGLGAILKAYLLG